MASIRLDSQVSAARWLVPRSRPPLRGLWHPATLTVVLVTKRLAAQHAALPGRGTARRRAAGQLGRLAHCGQEAGDVCRLLHQGEQPHPPVALGAGGGGAQLRARGQGQQDPLQLRHATSSMSTGEDSQGDDLQAGSTMTTATTHAAKICCACGEETDLLQWVEGHRVCIECSSALSQEVWGRVERGVELRPGCEGAAHSALLDLIEDRSGFCETLPDLAQCVVPPMRLMLMAGFNHHDRPREWVLVTRDGELTVDPIHARLFAFSAEGSKLGFVAARKWTEVLSRDCRVVPFVARVLVTGDPDAPDGVVEAWRFEGDQPTDRNYPFDKD